MPVTDKIQRLYAIVRELEAEYPGRKFTLDGHLVGSIGEVVAAERYGIELYPASVAVHDGRLPDGREVQIKATQGKTISIRECPEVLLVLKIEPDGTLHEVYFGDGKPAWDATGAMQKNGQRMVSLAKLRKILDSSDTQATDRALG